MELSAQQLEQFDRDGFLVFPDLFSRPEIAVLRREVARLRARGFDVAVNYKSDAASAAAVVDAVKAAGGRALIVGGGYTIYGNADRRRFLDWLESHPADLVVVQEVTAAWARDLARLPGYSHRLMLAREDPYGIGVLSRWPLGQVEPSQHLEIVVRVSGISRRFEAVGLTISFATALLPAEERLLEDHLVLDAGASLRRRLERPDF